MSHSKGKKERGEYTTRMLNTELDCYVVLKCKSKDASQTPHCTRMMLRVSDALLVFSLLFFSLVLYYYYYIFSQETLSSQSTYPDWFSSGAILMQMVLELYVLFNMDCLKRLTHPTDDSQSWNSAFPLIVALPEHFPVAASRLPFTYVQITYKSS